MASTAMMKQIIDFNKKAFHESFDILITVQEHSEKMVRASWGKSSFFPTEGTKAIEDWMVAYKKGLDAFREDVDRRFEVIRSCLSAVEEMESFPLSAAAEKKVPVKSAGPKKNLKAQAAKSVRVTPPSKKGSVPRKKTAK